MSDEDKTIGARGRRPNQEQDAHATGKARRSAPANDDAHATGKARRGEPAGGADAHATGKARRGAPANDDAHATGKARRGEPAGADAHATGKARRGGDGDALRPYEHKGAKDLQDRMADRTDTSGQDGWPDYFELEGHKYKNEGILSDSSGEAIVFTVTRGGKKYALKIYYYDPDHRPNHALLEKIRQLSGSGLLVNIVSHGEWMNPARKGEKNDYELMDFCEGGSLDGVVLDGDEKALTEVAVRMASAIDFLAKHGILHRDIKPANFFYADKAKTQIVLADFGISVECAEGEYVKIDEMRSPVYAAPEFYTNVPGEPAEVGVESDYFSLGVSLLCLWMGKAKLTANESQLLRSKLNETLPMPKDMSEHMISLIKALTRLKMSDRATFADIRKWAQGESLDGAEAEANSDFRVVFNSAKNEVAHSPSELAHYLVSDPVLGKKYIYSGRVTRWLEETGRNEIAVNVEEIVEELHADNQEAGLWAVAYMLDPAMDYIAPDGKEFTDPAEIATHIFANHSEMADEVINPESRFMIYLTALKMDKTVDAIQDYVSSDDYDCQMDDEDLNRFVAAYYLAVLLNKEIAFPVSTGDGWEYVDSVEELLAVYKREGDLDSINKAMLSSQAFIVWLSYRRPELAGKIRMLHDKADWEDETSPYFAASSAYRIAYELDPQADFDFNTDTSDPNRIYTVEQVGLYLNDRLNRMCLGEQDEDDFTELFVEMDSHPLGDYLRARGEKYAAFLDWNRYCMDVDSADNSQKAGPYDAVIGAYKSVAGFLGSEPVYPVGDKLISSPDELKGMKNVCTMFGGEEREMPAGDDKPVAWLDAWLATFYQENPKLDLSEQFTYEKETAKYVEYIGKLCPDNYFYKRYNKAIKKVDTAAGKMRSSERSLKAKRMFFIIAGGVPTLLALVLSWFMDAPEENPIAGHVFPAFLICTICLFLSLRATAGFGGAIIPALIGGAICTGIAYAGFAWFPTVLYLVAGAILLVGGILAVVRMRERSMVDTGGKVIHGDEFEYRQLDALYYAYRQEGEALNNAVTQLSDMQRQKDAGTRDDIGTVGWMWAPVAWMIFLLWFFATPQISGSAAWTLPAGAERPVPGKWVLGTWEVKYASGSTRIVCNIDSVSEGKNIYGTMVIAGQAPVKAKGFVHSRHDTIPKSFIFFPADGGHATKRCVDADYSESKKAMTGYYYDRKGIMHQIEFTKTPLDAQKPEAGKANAETEKPKAPSKPAKAKKKAAEPEPDFSDYEQQSEPQSQPEEEAVPHLWEDTM